MTILGLLRLPDYRRVWLLGGIANAMRWLEILAGTLWVFEQTGSALAVSAVVMMRALPMLLLGAVAGALAERFDRRLVLAGLQATSAFSAGVVVALSFAGIAEAARFARGDPRLRLVLALTLVMNVFAFAYGAVLPAFGAVAFGVSGAAVGLLAAAEPFGALLGGLWLTLRPGRAPGAASFVVGSGSFLVLLLVVSQMDNYWLALGLLVLGGLGTARFAALQTSIAMAAAPPAMRSRVLGLVTTCIGCSPFGVLAMGVLADGLGVRAGMVVMAGAGLLVMVGFLGWERFGRGSGGAAVGPG